MAKIQAPNKQYTGVSAGVSFVNGVGECSDPYLLQWFREHGYEVEETQESNPDLDSYEVEETQESNPDLDSLNAKPIERMTVAELKEYADQNSINLGDATKKDDILMLIQASKGGAGNGN
ncbi:hypothetical protein [Paenibacillus naphthalenovorans]|uniref:hypothetical protein n=1 Tax=Paenibacillus naphthalenovorans TaxID=162209 RepID=UPI000880EFFF|nr:hypothetical protein [Paenibacillus naphthalenovorans]SDJ76580.1 hypothetical protein SAMN05421868_14326 [Paenibacillus naphthalenovorans]